MKDSYHFEKYSSNLCTYAGMDYKFEESYHYVCFDN